MTRDELKLICLILNTADYCYNTISQVRILDNFNILLNFVNNYSFLFSWKKN
jgi:hypothetical protein